MNALLNYPGAKWGMPFDVTYGGTRTVGTAAIADGVATFTKATA